MSKEKEELNMDLFSNEPVVDMTGDENIDYLFSDETEDDLEDNPNPKEKDEITPNEDEPIEVDPEEVVGEEDEPEEVEPKTDDKPVDDDSSEPNLFTSLTALLAEKGLVSSDDSEINVKSEEDFVELIKKQIETSEYSDLNDLQKEYLQKLREGIPHQKVEKDLNQLNRLESITDEVIESDSELRQRVIYQDLINKGFSEERAKKNLQRSIELEQDIEDSKEALESIKAFEKQRIDKENLSIKEQIELNRKQEEKRISSIKEKIKNTEEVIKNFKITESIKQKVEKNMFEVVGENPETKTKENALMKYRRENPEDFDHKLYYLFTISDGFKNFDSLVKNTNSRVLKDLEKAVKSNTAIKDPGSPAYLEDPNSYSVDIAGHEIVVE